MFFVSSGVRFFSRVSALGVVSVVSGVTEVAVVGSSNRVVSRSRMIFDLVLWDIFFLPPLAVCYGYDILFFYLYVLC